MILTPEQLQENWDKLLNYIPQHISEPRASQLTELYKNNEEYFIFAPASSKKEFHGCWAGGLVYHFISVIENSLSLYEIWKSKGANLDTFTVEELVFSALNHDLGKKDAYIPSTDKWRQEKLGELYTFNTELPFASVPDRSLFILQQEGIKYSFNEMIAIQTHDGLYDEANKKYLQGFLPEQKPRTCLPYILHQADIMAARIEFEMEHIELLNPNKPSITATEKKETFKLEVKKPSIKQKALNSTNSGINSNNLMNLLNDL